MSNIILNEEQNNVYDNLLKFLQSNENEVLLIGYAGTGKTTLITKFINDIIKDKLVKRIALAAPTHKAVGIIKNKLYGNLYEKDNSKSLTKYVEVLTIHRLLNYQNYIDNNGNTYFAKGLVDTNWDIYNLIVIDECSMLNNQIINDIILELQKNYEENKNNKLKVIYLGDPAQLPPVNQKISKIFTRDITKYYLEKIIRTNNNNIMDLSNQHRKWILSGDDKDMPNLELYNSNTIKIHDNSKEWLNNFINNNNKNNIILSWTNKKCNLYNDYIRKAIFKKENLAKYELGEILIFQDYYRVKIDDNKENNNYINFYTSEQVKLYDIKTKIIKFDNLKIKKISSILPENIVNIYTECIEKLNKIIDDNPIKIYELQVRKINGDENIYIDNYNNIKKKIEINIYKSKSKTLSEDDKTYIIKNIDKNINFMNNLVHKYHESLINNGLINTFNKNITITSIHEDDAVKYNELIEIGNIKLLKLKERLYSKINKIKNIDNIEKCNFFSIIEKKMNTLWKEWQNKIIDSNAQLNYGYCITVHKSQGSTFSNVYIDIADIFENKSKDEVLKCLYTAITRTSDSLELLL